MKIKISLVLLYQILIVVFKLSKMSQTVLLDVSVRLVD